MIRATMARGDGTLPGCYFACQRCGLVRKYNIPRGKPELCLDCRELKAMEKAS